MKDELDVGCSPSSEDCAQVGRDDYHHRAKVECRTYINQLRRMFGSEPEGASLHIKANPHDFGTYQSVVCRFDSNNKTAAEYAFRLESKGPEHWDDQAWQELLDGYKQEGKS
jgi:hypothetical protein